MLSEKYRPGGFDEVVAQDKALSRIRAVGKNGLRFRIDTLTRRSTLREPWENVRWYESGRSLDIGLSSARPPSKTYAWNTYGRAVASAECFVRCPVRASGRGYRRVAGVERPVEYEARETATGKVAAHDILLAIGWCATRGIQIQMAAGMSTSILWLCRNCSAGQSSNTNACITRMATAGTIDRRTWNYGPAKSRRGNECLTRLRGVSSFYRSMRPACSNRDIEGVDHHNNLRAALQDIEAGAMLA